MGGELLRQDGAAASDGSRQARELAQSTLGGILFLDRLLQSRDVAKRQEEQDDDVLLVLDRRNLQQQPQRRSWQQEQVSGGGTEAEGEAVKRSKRARITRRQGLSRAAIMADGQTESWCRRRQYAAVAVAAAASDRRLPAGSGVLPTLLPQL